MLCRTANELFWMSRHIERAENTARMLDVTYRMSLLPYEVIEPGLAWAEPWAVPLITSGLATEYYERHPVLSAENVLRFMILDSANPSSIFCCLRAARESARSVRGAITSEMYEDLNSSWLEARGYDYARLENGGVSEFLDWVKMRSHLFRGVTFGTLLREGGLRRGDVKALPRKPDGAGAFKMAQKAIALGPTDAFNYIEAGEDLIDQQVPKAHAREAQASVGVGEEGEVGRRGTIDVEAGVLAVRDEDSKLKPLDIPHKRL
jgi:hypothetical protein